MRICDILERKEQIFSFEFFPPKTREDTHTLFCTIRDLAPLKPSFVSVTQSTAGIGILRTAALSGLIKKVTGVEVMAHLTCISHTKKDIAVITDGFKKMNIENILALRGDMPPDSAPIRKTDFTYGNELISHLAGLGSFCVGGACYPEGHPEAPSPEADMKNLKKKTDAGAKFLITQLFFENKLYFDFAARCRKAGISVPLIPGIMPITGFKQIKLFTEKCHAAIPAKIMEEIEPFRDNKQAIEDYGVNYAFKQCVELLNAGAPGIHFYTLNRSKATGRILNLIRKTYR